jgi:nitronate monooxygenase
VAQGSEAGGHRGTFLHEVQDALIGGLALVPAVADHVSVPLLAAGGISDGRGIAAALALGAAGAQIGTIFLRCPESAAADVHKSLVAGGTRPTTVTDRLTGRAARGFRTRVDDELARAGVDALPYPLQLVFTEPIRRAAVEQRREDLAIALAGQGQPRSASLGAGELLKALVRETEEALARL